MSPILVLPFGPLIVLALLRWQNREAWLLILMAVMPQRMVYDQIPLLLTARTPRQLLLLVECSWTWILSFLFLERSNFYEACCGTRRAQSRRRLRWTQAQLKASGANNRRAASNLPKPRTPLSTPVGTAPKRCLRDERCRHDREALLERLVEPQAEIANDLK
jgi:hypothetical protein